MMNVISIAIQLTLVFSVLILIYLAYSSGVKL